MAKYAIMLNAATDDSHAGAAANGLEYGIDLANAGHDADIYFDGAATRWPAVLRKQEDHPVAKYYEEVTEMGLVAGACGYCADSYDAVEALEAEGIPLLDDAAAGHGPDVGALVDEGYELLTVG
jgi:hypothetical protein